jgi:hypothetical protein
MFRLMDHQISMEEAHFWMPEGHREELERTWPHIFRTQVLKMIPESQFSGLYHATMGRPNFPVAILVGLSILKEMFDLTDEALMSSFRFDMRYHYALGIKLEETELALRTLYYFRAAVAGSDAVGATFDEVADRIIAALGLDTSRQRKDSTHIRSNMTNLTRLGLFVQTIGHFLGRLEKDFLDRYHLLPEEIIKRYGERKGRFADAKSSEGRRRLDVTAQDLWLLVERFREDGSISQLPEYRLLERLLNEQCDIQSDADGVPVVMKDPKKISSDSLQSPFDPDASYDGHKGVGYQVQVSETCSPDNPIQVVTRIDVEPAHHSDQHALIPALDDLEVRGHIPEKMFADTAYNSGANLIAAAQRGVDLVSPTPGKADPDGIGMGDFDLDLEALRVRACPEGEHPIQDRLGSDGETRNLRFDPERCKVCELALDCSAGKENGRLRVNPKNIAIAFSRAREETEEFKKDYRIRAGGESINAECKTAHGLAKVWTRGEPKVTFAATMKFLACNVKRFMRYRCVQMLEKMEKRELVPA